MAARRGADLLRTYGQYHFLGKLVAVAQRSRVEGKYTKVTERLRSLMPSMAPPHGAPLTPKAAAIGDGGSSASPFQAAATGGSGGSGGGVAAAHLAAGGNLARPAVVSRGGGGGADPSVVHTAAICAGQVLREGRNERVFSVAFAPAAVAAASGGLCVWWALESCVEFYSDAAQSTTSFATEGSVFLSCVAIDNAGNTWGGTSSGTLLMRRPCVWDSQAEERLFAGAVRAITFDPHTGTVWAGDEHGCVRAARLQDDTGRIHLLLTVLAGRSSRRGLSASSLIVAPTRYVDGWRFSS